MASKRVTKTQRAELPALYTPPALDIDGDDITLPRMYMGQGMSAAVTDGDMKVGDLYIALGPDDPDPEVVWQQGSDKPGVLVSVLSLKRGWSLNRDNDLFTWDYHDPDRDPEARPTWDYMLAVHEPAQDLPVKFLLKGASTSSAKQMNLVLRKAQLSGTPAYAVGFWVAALRRTRSESRGSYAAARVTRAELTDEQIAKAAELAEMVASAPQAKAPAPADEPEI